MMSQKKFEDLYAHDRHPLHKVIPLDTPYSINVEPSSYCNIKCVYCVHSQPLLKLSTLGYSDNYRGGNMTAETFDLLVSQLAEFPRKIKSITFGGVGEPLLHPDLPQMIQKIKEYNITDRINLITNGLLLSPKTSSALIQSGLTSMKISLQGIDSTAYYNICGCRINFSEFLSNLSFLYQNRNECAIGIKIADISLYQDKSETDKLHVEEHFQKLFSNKCDRLGIEHIVPSFPDVDYSKVKGISGHLSRYNIAEKVVQCCSQPFYRMNIMQNGCVTLCTMLGYHDKWMNIHHTTLKKIWDSPERKQKLIKLLQGIQDDEMALCRQCNIKNDFAYDEDYLDPYVKDILKRF